MAKEQDYRRPAGITDDVTNVEFDVDIWGKEEKEMGKDGMSNSPGLRIETASLELLQNGATFPAKDTRTSDKDEKENGPVH